MEKERHVNNHTRRQNHKGKKNIMKFQGGWNYFLTKGWRSFGKGRAGP
jgi:hypothetical protein